MEVGRSEKVLQFESRIATLEKRQTRLDAEHQRLGRSLSKHPTDTPKQRENFENLRTRYDRVGNLADRNRSALKQEQKEYDNFKQGRDWKSHDMAGKGHVDVERSHTPHVKDSAKRISGVEDKGTKDSLVAYNTRQDSEIKGAGRTLTNSGVKTELGHLQANQTQSQNIQNKHQSKENAQEQSSNKEKRSFGKVKKNSLGAYSFTQKSPTGSEGKSAAGMDKASSSSPTSKGLDKER